MEKKPGSLAEVMQGAAADSGEGEMEQPASMSEDGQSLFLDKEGFPKDCAEGDTVMIKATVKSVGSKVEVVPDEITKADEPDTEEGADSGPKPAEMFKQE